MSIMRTTIFRDIIRNKSKSIVMFLALLSGAVLIGVVSLFGSFFMPKVTEAYQNALPHDAIIRTGAFNPEILEDLRKISQISEAGARTSRLVRIAVGDNTYNVNLIAQDYTYDVDVLRSAESENRMAIPDVDQAYIERSAMEDIGIPAGGEIRLILENGRSYSLTLAEYVYDAVCEPYTLEGDVPVYVSEETMTRMTGESGFDEILLRVDDTIRNRESISDRAQVVTDALSAKGITVYETEVPEPGTFYATQAIDALYMIMLLLGSLSVLLAGIVTVLMIQDLIAKRMRLIAIMKTIGGQKRQIRHMYLGMLLGIGAAVLLLSVPATYLVGYAVCNFLAGYLNVRLQVVDMPLLPLLPVAMSVFVLPVAAAWIPIVRSTSVSVREGLNGHRAGKMRSVGGINPVSSKPGGKLIYILSIRNLWQNATRNLLSLSALTLAGAVFMTGLCLQMCFSRAINNADFLFPDGILTLSSYEDAARIEEIATGTEGLTTVEAWGFARGQFVEEATGNSKKVRLMAPEPDSTIIDATRADSLLIEGRWIMDENANEIVISNHLTEIFPQIKVGDAVEIRINDAPVTFTVVGCVGLFGRPADPVLIVGYPFLNELLAGENLVKDLRGITVEHTEDAQTRVFSDIEERLRQNGIQVSEMNLGEQMKEQFSTSTTVVVWLLVFLSLMVGLVGLVGLSGAMSLSVLEREREFGVLKTIGASHTKIRRILMTEGLLLSGLSWVFGILLSLPLTMLFGNTLGELLLGSGTGLAMDWKGILLWLLISSVGAVIASLIPCARIYRTSIKDSLRCE